MFSVELNNLGKASRLIYETSTLLKKDAKIIRSISSETHGNTVLDKCKGTLERLGERMSECASETASLGMCLDGVIDCYRGKEQELVGNGPKNSDTSAQVQLGIYDYSAVASTLESLNIKMVTV